MWHDLYLASPLLIVIVIGLIGLLAAAFAPPGTPRGWVGSLVALGFVTALALTLSQLAADPESLVFTTHSFLSTLVLDRFALALIVVILVGATLMTLASSHYLAEQRSDHGEYYALIAFATSGMIALVMATELLTVFIAVELMSIPIYILAGFKRDSRFSTESAVKYFVLGAFASAILLLGIAFVYGATGELNLHAIGQILLVDDNVPSEFATLGLVLLVTGFFFKIGAVPLHMWTPDVYEGAPSTATGFMAVAVKTAAFGVFARILLTAFGSVEFRTGPGGWETLIAIGAAASMFVGNLMALNQRNLKRMLAYSAIAHTGYLLVALLVRPAVDGDPSAAMNALGGGLIFYLLAYTVANTAAFGVAAAISGKNNHDLDEAAYAGLAKRRPALAVVLTVSMLSLLGIPLTAGFMGKLTIFEEVLSSRNNHFLWLVIVAVVNSAISAWYYLRVLLVTFMHEERADRPIQLIDSRPLNWSLALSTIATLIFGLMPSSALDISTHAGKSLAASTVPSTLLVSADARSEVQPVQGAALLEPASRLP